MSLNSLAKKIHKNAVDKGFYDNPPEVGVRLMEMVSELSEALEADKINHKALVAEFESFIKNDFKVGFELCIKNSFEDEMADVLIRVLDYCAYRGIDIDKHVKYKMRYNKTRERLHGKKY